MTTVVTSTAPLWAVFWVVLTFVVALFTLLTWTAVTLAGVRDREARYAQWARQADERARAELHRQNALRSAHDVDGWLDSVQPAGSRPGDGVVLSGRVTNRTTAPIWDLIAQVIDPRTNRVLPLVPVAVPVLPPHTGWPLEWACGCGGLPTPGVLTGMGTARPVLRVMFTDANGRWARQGASTAPVPVTAQGRLPSGCQPWSRAVEAVSHARAGLGDLDEHQLADDVEQAVVEVTRHRLAWLTSTRLDLDILPSLLTRSGLPDQVQLEEAVAHGPMREVLRGLAVAVEELAGSLRAASTGPRETTCSDRDVNPVGDASTRAQLLLHRAGGVLTALGSIRNTPGAAAGSRARGAGGDPATPPGPQPVPAPEELVAR